MKLNGFVPLFVALERVRTKLLNVQGIGGYVERGRKRRKLIGQLENMTLARL